LARIVPRKWGVQEGILPISAGLRTQKDRNVLILDNSLPEYEISGIARKLAKTAAPDHLKRKPGAFEKR
jgi:hypothetical protein